MKARISTLLLAVTCILATVQGKVYTIAVDDPQTWENTAVSARSIGDTVQFDVPVIVNQNYGYNGFSGLTVSVRRIYSPTNQAVPLSAEYQRLLQLDATAGFNLSGCGYKRNGERLLNLKGVVTGPLQVKFISGSWAGNNTREKLEHNVPKVDGDTTHNLLVCAANLEYYLVQNLGTGFGPANNAMHQRQRTKVSKALAEIRADIYGLVEIEQGQSALAEIANDLTSLIGDPTHYQYDYINDGGSASGSYTKSGYVYNRCTVDPIGKLTKNNTVVSNRKMVQGFILKENNECFIYSINHFKAKSGSGSGKNADQGDGQGTFNYNRTQEALSLLHNIEAYQHYYEDPDILIMGDLNAYAKEDPIRTLTDGGMYDLHRYFHADSSYSYVYGYQAGYLDHALANRALLDQVTGMNVWHVNSDESDKYTYDKSDDLTVFRYSDHDPVLVGLCLDSTKSVNTKLEDLINLCSISLIDGSLYLENVGVMGESYGFYEIYGIRGELIQGVTQIEESPCLIGEGLPGGMYIVRVYYAGKTRALKMMK